VQVKEITDFRDFLRGTFFMALLDIAIFVAIAVLVAQMLGAVAYRYFRDATDQPGFFENKSGMQSRIDYFTGCQYLTTKEGGLTPRIGLSGEHMGCGQ
jgi:hypothetical protein